MFRRFLPFIFSSGLPASGPQVIVTDVPAGYSPHGENPQVAVDRTGTIFAATRPSSGTGGIVWKQRPGEASEIVLQLGPEQSFALGEFFMHPNGHLYYSTISRIGGVVGKQIVSYPVPGWTPNE